MTDQGSRTPAGDASPAAINAVIAQSASEEPGPPLTRCFRGHVNDSRAARCRICKWNLHGAAYSGIDNRGDEPTDRGRRDHDPHGADLKLRIAAEAADRSDPRSGLQSVDGPQRRGAHRTKEPGDAGGGTSLTGDGRLRLLAGPFATARRHAVVALAAILIVLVAFLAFAVLGGPQKQPHVVLSPPALSIEPAAVTAGDTILVQGHFPAHGCALSATPQVGLTTKALLSAATSSQNEEQVLTRYRLPATIRPGKYTVAVHCGAGIGTASAMFTVLAPVPNEILDTAKKSTVRLTATSCGGSDYGTGVLVRLSATDPAYVVTALPVLSAAVVVAIRTQVGTVPGHIVGALPTLGVAIVQLGAAAPELVAATPRNVAPAQVSSIALAGYAARGEPRTALGAMAIANDGTPSIRLSGNPKLADVSGSAIIDATGALVGIARGEHPDGTLNTISLTQITTALRLIGAPPQSVPVPSCDAPKGPDIGEGAVAPPDSGADATAIATTLSTYFNALNQHDWAKLSATMTPDLQNALAASAPPNVGDRSTYDFQVIFHRLSTFFVSNSVKSGQARITFTSIQNAALSRLGAETCDNWDVTFTLRRQNAKAWLIQSSQIQDVTPC